jgi:hypothetical protein
VHVLLPDLAIPLKLIAESVGRGVGRPAEPDQELLRDGRDPWMSTRLAPARCGRTLGIQNWLTNVAGSVIGGK